MFRNVLRFSLLAVIAFATGCASFPADKLPFVGNLPDKSAFKNKPSVYLDAKVVTSLDGSAPATENKAASRMFQERVGKVTRASGLFATHTLDAFKAEKMDYTIRLEMLNHADAGLAALAGVVTGLTLGVIPSAATDHYRLTATVVSKSGKELKTYTVDDSVTTWLGIWFIPFMGDSPNVIVPQVWENMVKTVYKKLAEEDLLKYSYRSGGTLLAAAY